MWISNRMTVRGEQGGPLDHMLNPATMQQSQVSDLNFFFTQQLKSINE